MTEPNGLEWPPPPFRLFLNRAQSDAFTEAGILDDVPWEIVMVDEDGPDD